MSDKLLISEIKMNSQDFVHTNGHNTKKRRVHKYECGDVKQGAGGISRIDHQCDIQKLSQQTNTKIRYSKTREQCVQRFW